MNYRKVKDLPKSFQLVQTDHEIRDILDYVHEDESFTYIFVKLDKSQADIDQVYGINDSMPFLDSYLTKIK